MNIYMEASYIKGAYALLYINFYSIYNELTIKTFIIKLHD